MPKPLNLVGKTFGKLTVINKSDNNKFGKTTWLCKCSCGSEKVIIGSALKNGITKSCGCLKREVLTERNFKHGKSYKRIYTTWQNMKSRCGNPNRQDYKNYGGRGISVCEEWLNDFESFFNWSIDNGYKDHLTIDRINNDMGYSPNNCRWTTQKEQMRNFRNNIYIDINGEQLTMTAIAEKYNVSREAVRERYKKGIRGMDLIKGLKKTGVTVKPESISYSVEV
ncbi:hypothetical protein NST02_17990 [Robertmurraya sp. FSL W8-0741]|uniref:hypothetical protein n=1 Tax=Robertmurraya sp. FSL W8-0741 TaxID=2954629 RepID=UPI0030F6F86A